MLTPGQDILTEYRAPAVIPDASIRVGNTGSLLGRHEARQLLGEMLDHDHLRRRCTRIVASSSEEQKPLAISGHVVVAGRITVPEDIPPFDRLCGRARAPRVTVRRHGHCDQDAVKRHVEELPASAAPLGLRPPATDTCHCPSPTFRNGRT